MGKKKKEKKFILLFHSSCGLKLCVCVCVRQWYLKKEKKLHKREFMQNGSIYNNQRNQTKPNNKKKKKWQTPNSSHPPSQSPPSTRPNTSASPAYTPTPKMETLPSPSTSTSNYFPFPSRIDCRSCWRRR